MDFRHLVYLQKHVVFVDEPTGFIEQKLFGFQRFVNCVNNLVIPLSFFKKLSNVAVVYDMFRYFDVSNTFHFFSCFWFEIFGIPKIKSNFFVGFWQKKAVNCNDRLWILWVSQTFSIFPVFSQMLFFLTIHSGNTFSQEKSQNKIISLFCPSTMEHGKSFARIFKKNDTCYPENKRTCAESKKVWLFGKNNLLESKKITPK